MLHNFILSIAVYVQTKVWKAFTTTEAGPVAGLVPPCLLFALFSGWIPIGGVEARHVYLLAPAFKFHERERAQGGALSDIQAGAGGLT